MGSGSPIDDLVEFGTIRLLNWNYSMTDIELGMRFVDKVQAVSAVRKYSVSVGREYRVLKIANDPEIPVSNIIQEVQILFQTGCTYKWAWYARKFVIERVFGSWDTTFSILPKYLQAVHDINPGTI
ncbi:hypothetical protein M9H77_14251 [Catharanthus roseus]|uniref:Uncharacterized protein n=1 Tax=Catharanthus roseus TaxID=4058 RepID=A0ACC0BMT0_CATRO|nr:hypothetical protein M9H77_14251 [Catharanthus roseus]